MTEVKIQEIANKIVKEVSMLPNLSEYEAMMLCATKALRGMKENEKQNINLANKALIKRGVEWLKKGLDNGMWVDQFLNIKEKKAIIEHFKEWMEEKNKKKKDSMRFWQTHSTGSDETAPYNVTDYKAINADDFAREVIISQPHEWGNIKVDGFGKVEYRNGELLGEIPESWKYLTVVSVKSSGGWSNMDYNVRVSPSIDYYKLYQK